MDQEKLEALLGRPLTAREVTNRKLYLNIAKASLESLTCLDLSCKSTEEDRTFTARAGYSTVFVGIFTEVQSVTVNGEVVDATTYHPAFFDNRNGSVFNSIVFDTAFGCDEDVVINAVWGFESLPNDLAMLYAQLFANTSKAYATGSVKSKKVEDFSITYGDLTDEQAFVNQNARILSKYSLCGIGNVKHGNVYRRRDSWNLY